MSNFSGRGAIANLQVTPDGDFVRNFELQANGSDYDLTNATLEVRLRDSDDSNRIIGTVSQTITGAAAGEFTLKIPKSYFGSKQSEDLYYQLIKTEGGNETCLMSGEINIAEVV